MCIRDRWILALVQVITIGPVSENLAALATFYNDESNWKDPAAYKANQDVKKAAYEAYDATMASDPAAIEEFEQGGGVASYILPYQVMLGGPGIYILFMLAPFTLFISYFLGIGLGITINVFGIIALFGLFSTTAPATLISWMPPNGEEGGAAPADGGDDQ